jgi:U4/U6 small nuclear ribonucleoprotein PRP31
MTTLAESFLADLDDLSDDEVQPTLQQGDEEDTKDNALRKNATYSLHASINDVSTLTSSEEYRSVMSVVSERLEQQQEETTQIEDNGVNYDFIVQCNRLIVEIDNEIVNVYNYIRDQYRSKFPELESLVQAPLEYAAVVRAIGNDMDVTNVDLDSILPASTVMVVTVTATTTSGQPLSEDGLARVLDACALAAQLDADKSRILDLVQKSMDRIAPNLTACVGSEIAAKLMGVAGGLQALSTIPACNIQVLGAKRKHAAGFSSKTSMPHQGFIYESELVQNTPPGLRNRAAKLVGSKCSLLARVDAHGTSAKDKAEVGKRTREEIVKKIEKWQEPPPARKGDVLPVPDAQEMKKTRRGGRKVRKMKEKYGMTELKKQANRMLFNQAEDEFIDGEETIGLGAIGKDGSGRLRALAAQQKQKLSAKAAKKHGLRNYGAASGIATSGLSSSLAFTPIQGIELVNPNNVQQRVKDEERQGTESYFSEKSGFKSSVIIPKTK